MFFDNLPTGSLTPTPHRLTASPYHTTTSQVLYDWSGAVVGVATGDSGIGRDGKQIEGRYAPGVELRARATLLAEGCRGSLSEVSKGGGRAGGLRGSRRRKGAAGRPSRCSGVTIIPGHPSHLVHWPLLPLSLIIACLLGGAEDCHCSST